MPACRGRTGATSGSWRRSRSGHRVAGPLMRGMRHIPVDRHKGGEAFAAAIRALRAGEIVGVFPEATMSRSFELKEFKPGAVKMAQVAGVPVLPTTIWGAQRVWTKSLPKHMRPVSRIPINITVGEPIEIGRRDDVMAATERLKAVMQAQLDAQQAVYPALHGDDLVYQPARLGGTAPTPEAAHAADLHDMTRTRDKFTGYVPTAAPSGLQSVGESSPSRRCAVSRTSSSVTSRVLSS